MAMLRSATEGGVVEGIPASEALGGIRRILQYLVNLGERPACYPWL